MRVNVRRDFTLESRNHGKYKIMKKHLSLYNDHVFCL